MFENHISAETIPTNHVPVDDIPRMRLLCVADLPGNPSKRQVTRLKSQGTIQKISKWVGTVESLNGT
jgi:hypothetical protein